ncbi:MAG: hypothetical protein WC965_01980 [Thiohalomonadaceae bacterium]
MTYTIRLAPQYTTEGRQIKNIGGRVVVFNDGVAYGVVSHIAMQAGKYPFVGAVAEERVPLEETPAEETPAEETPAEETPAEETPAEETPAEEVPAEEIPAEEETPDVAALYEELGTWKAVAEHLDITTAALRKLRDEQGL